MKLALPVLSFVASASVAAAGYDLDTYRPIRTFGPPKQFKVGYAYTSSFNIAASTTLLVANDGIIDADLSGSGYVAVTADASVEVKEFQEEGEEIDLTITHLSGVSDTDGMGNIYCDSDHPEASQSDECLDLYAWVTTYGVDLDEDGDLVDLWVTGKDGDQHSLSDDLGDVLLVIRTIQQSWRPFPTLSLKPGDSWFVTTNIGQLVYFAGTVALVGYTNYKDKDCAVFYARGSIDFSSEYIESMLTDVAAMNLDSDASLEVSDAQGIMVIIYDYEEETVRWMKIQAKYVIDMSFNTTYSESYSYSAAFISAFDVVDRPDVEALATEQAMLFGRSRSASRMNVDPETWEIETWEPEEWDYGSHRGGLFFLVASLSVAGGALVVYLFVSNMRRQGYTFLKDAEETNAI